MSRSRSNSVTPEFGRNHCDEFSTQGLAAKVTITTDAMELAATRRSFTSCPWFSKACAYGESSGNRPYLALDGAPDSTTSVRYVVGNRVSSQSKMTTGELVLAIPSAVEIVDLRLTFLQLFAVGNPGVNTSARIGAIIFDGADLNLLCRRILSSLTCRLCAARAWAVRRAISCICHSRCSCTLLGSDCGVLGAFSAGPGSSHCSGCVGSESTESASEPLLGATEIFSSLAAFAPEPAGGPSPMSFAAAASSAASVSLETSWAIPPSRCSKSLSEMLRRLHGTASSSSSAAPESIGEGQRPQIPARRGRGTWPQMPADVAATRAEPPGYSLPN
mmetsp:Transcript_57900/g.148940  ORF Transcript_57900/g.148940 Transcript_57900/m.148940 type:complete len:332 (+) Transcript_57900:496-1491(+)